MARPKAGSERARDEQRSEDTPRYEGAPWRDPEGIPDEPSHDEVTDPRVESSKEQEGIGRGEKPRKPKVRTKPNPKPRKTRKSPKKRR